jgi:hypothetical protein
VHSGDEQFLAGVSLFLGWFYLVASALNLGAAWRAFRRRGGWKIAVCWLAWGALFGASGCFALQSHPPRMPEGIKAAVDALLGPVTFTLGTFLFLGACYFARRVLVRGPVAWTGLNLSLLFLGTSLTDAQFAAVVGKPDNVPIVAMVYLLAFFTWWGAAQAEQNDRRASRDEGPVEKEFDGTVLVWPDLVYIELICMVLLMIVLIVWSLAIQAPLEQPADPVLTPNPSKAPWYFLGLQEMLGYFDPSIAGVTLPALIILGLMAIPYLDFNEKGNGYYTIAQRRFSYVMFMFGFLQLWVMLILIGTFMRGPNWNFFGLYEYRDPHKIPALYNVKLSEYFWATWLGRAVPQVPADAGSIARLGAIVLREIAGLVSLGAYFILLPVLAAKTFAKRFRQRMGRGRYWIMALLLLMMLTLPLKMILRWTLNMSYIVSIPEYLFSF